MSDPNAGSTLTSSYSTVGSAGKLTTAADIAAVPATIGTPKEIVRRFDSKANIKRAKKNGIQFDAKKGAGIPTTTTDIAPVDPDAIMELLGARNAEHYMDIDISRKKVIRQTSKSGVKEIKVAESIAKEDIISSGRVQKSTFEYDK